jgi:hypothetical protein
VSLYAVVRALRFPSKQYQLYPYSVAHMIWYILLPPPAHSRCPSYCAWLFLITYLLTPWSRVLLENLIGLQLVKKFPEFYKTRNFITACTLPATCPYPEPDGSSPYPHILLPEGCAWIMKNYYWKPKSSNWYQFSICWMWMHQNEMSNEC